MASVVETCCVPGGVPIATDRSYSVASNRPQVSKLSTGASPAVASAVWRPVRRLLRWISTQAKENSAARAVGVDELGPGRDHSERVDDRRAHQRIQGSADGLRPVETAPRHAVPDAD